MAAVIRLKRLGTKKKPFMRIVVMDKASARDGRSIEQIGYYDPTKNPPTIKIDKEKALRWIKVGAVASDTVRSLFKKEGIV